jgi:4a-hydroxytetrahydrobiopterin dehydratase
MTRLTPRQFFETDGLADWRVLFTGALAYFRTGSFSAGTAFAAAIAERADAANHHPDVDVRYGGVTVRLISHDVGGLTERDVALAREISALARERGIEPDPTSVQDVQIAVDAQVHADVMPFWKAVLGYDDDGDTDLADPQARNPPIWFQEMDEGRPQRNRIHVDVCVPHEVAEARVAAALAAGGRVVRDSEAPEWWTLADAEGNEVDVATTHTRG